MTWFLVATAVFIRLFFWVYTGRVWEDSLITVLHSENFHAGLGLTHFKIDETPVHGFTSPLSVLIPLLGDSFRIGFGLRLLQLLSALAGGATVYLISLLVKAYWGPAPPTYLLLLIGGYVAFEHHQILWGMAGMETQFAVLAILCSLYCYECAPRLLGYAFGICMLVRPDFAMVVGALAALRLVRSTARGTTLSQMLWPAALLYLPWIVFTAWYYGSPIPNTILAKSAGYPLWWKVAAPHQLLGDLGVRVLALFGGLGPAFGGNGTGFCFFLDKHGIVVGLVMTLVVWGGIRAARKREWVFAAPFSLWILYAGYYLLLVPIIFGWYTVPLAALTVILAAKGLYESLQSAQPTLASRLGPVITTGYLLMFAGLLFRTIPAERNIQRLVEEPVRISIGHYLNRVMAQNQTVGGEPLGFIGYYSRRHYYDYPGLCSRKVMTYLRSVAHPDLSTMIGHFQPDYVVFRTFEFANFQRIQAPVAARYDVVRTFTVPATDRGKLLFPDRNIDLEFVLLRRRS